MKIAFLSSLDPDDIHNWSGTLYYIYHSLKRNNEVMWIGKDVLDEVKEYHYTYIEDRPFIPEYYAAFLCKLLTQKLKNEYYDIILCRDYFFCAYLATDRPLIYIGDTNFQLFKDYLNIKDKEYENLCDKLEYEALHNANKILYCSKWVKESAVKHYLISPQKIRVIEFGANLDIQDNFT